ncbi:RNA polymerase sigma factor [Marinobacterium arenosum]|uniref:RNA polymerase sigma factor n=1 Tax=Marinobacterium arenosum TaxID=2862496 RepID=UPI001C94827D|nr:RNA polymerase sigma factor [Marinobacterium arenosum]MBY4676364.1 RNA polymerase sigma factor [Marinobacterium arenosum]
MSTNFYQRALLASDLTGDDDGAGSASEAQQVPSLDALYQQHRPALLSHLQRMVKDPHIAEELLHDTFIRLSRMPALSSIRQPKSFLLKVASNLALDHLRQCQRQPDSGGEEELAEQASSEPGQLDLLLQERRQRRLREAIDQLPPRARETLLLVRYRELTLREAAQELGISQTMVEKHLKNALQKCRAVLQSDMQ